MVESQQQPEVSLVEFLTTRARRSSDTRLVLDAAIGLAAVLIALIWRPAGWHLIVSAALCFVAFGGWGITDRELRESAVDAAHSIGALKMLRITRAIAAGVGTLGAAALLVGLLGLALGTWIS
jgi:hypothetical protein